MKHAWDILAHVDTLVYKQMKQTALASVNTVLGDLNDELIAPHSSPDTSENETSRVTSPRSVESTDELPTGAEDHMNAPKPLKPSKQKTINPPTRCPVREKTRPDTPHPLTPPTPEEYVEARRRVQWDLLYKTSDCTSWSIYSGCPCGNKCRFLHPTEQRVPRPPEHVIDNEITAEAWRLTELRQVPQNRPGRTHARRRR